jgi:hypothetical protein
MRSAYSSFLIGVSGVIGWTLRSILWSQKTGADSTNFEDSSRPGGARSRATGVARLTPSDHFNAGRVALPRDRRRPRNAQPYL